MDTIYYEYDQALVDYSFITWGFHFQNFVQHLFFDERLNDFEEMLLHHIAANSLYFSYIFGNGLQLGSVIAYLHDLADIFSKSCKCLNATVMQNTSAAVFICCMLVWCWTRILSLPVMIHFIFTEFAFPAPYEHF